MTPERFYNSFQAAVILNVVLFAFGLLFIVTMTGIFVFSFIFRKGRLGTLFTFIFSVIVMGIAVSFYGCIAFYGWPYVHGHCKEAIQTYKGPQSNNFTVTIDGSLVEASFFDDNKPNRNITRELEIDIAALIDQKLVAGPEVVECLVDDDSTEHMFVCNKNTTMCIEYSVEPIDAPTGAPTEEPTEAPTDVPSESPTDGPSEAPTEEPTEAPTDAPTDAPSKDPQCAKGR